MTNKTAKKAVKKPVKATKKTAVKKTVAVADSDKDKGGRPKAVIDYDLLDELCKIQCTGEECAAILGVDYDTLNSHLIEKFSFGFSDYFKQKAADGKRSLRRRQFQTAMGIPHPDKKGEWSVPPNPTLQIWLGKQYLNQAEKNDVNLNANLRYENLPDDQLNEMLRKAGVKV